MYDYMNAPEYKIENVNHEIHILGIKLGYFPYLMWAFLCGLLIGGPIIGIGGIVCAGLLCRKFYFAEERGEPIPFDRKFHQIVSRCPSWLGGFLFSQTGKIQFGLKEYRT